MHSHAGHIIVRMLCRAARAQLYMRDKHISSSTCTVLSTDSLPLAPCLSDLHPTTLLSSPSELHGVT